MRTFAAALVIGWCVAAAGAIGQDLTREQQQAVDRQDRNQKDAKKLLADFEKAWAKDMETLGKPDMLIPPAFFREYFARRDAILTKCDAIQADLDKNQCPPGNERVKALLDWISATREGMKKFTEETAPKLAEMEKLADPANYPDLEADFRQIDALAKAYRQKSFASHPERVAELAAELPQASAWSSGKFKEYRPLLVLTGGRKSPLFRRYEALANAVKQFQAEAAAFLEKAKSEVPAILGKAEELAARAVAEKKPAFFTGGVRQQFDEAERLMKVCRAFASSDNADLAGLEAACEAARRKVDGLAEGLKEEILAGARPPEEKYRGGDREDLRARVIAAWKEAWPKDEILGVVFHMENFERTEKATWNGGAKEWTFEDRSVLAVTVIVKASDRIAATYPAYVNVNNATNAISIGVQTKGRDYVTREILLSNLR